MFKFGDSVPVALRPMIRNIISGWAEAGASPVVGVELFGRQIDFVRRPWPIADGEETIVGPEWEEDAQKLRSLIGA